MPRLLHHREPDDDCGCDDHSGGHDHHHRHDDDCGCDDCRRRRRRDRLIPVGNISVDCSPVSFETPGQARAIISCPVEQVVVAPVTRTIQVQIPTPSGCVLNVPITQTLQVPVVTRVNLPPVRVPFPQLVCPPTVLAGAGTGCPC